ncbi:hypothetical protein CYMTET_3154 [Cymbomonas tetramitiformis]|uniref:Centrosomal protein of 135 kDa n=1 Tax=Cymbomonas tetramitiformis TaxID=36881 RepID=A0AAE0H3W6_9CHLO|nr:hypothetical protein CYMTET_3154 [Cymbomonas tetramitiformis]
MEAPLTIDEARLAQLRRKLESLNYGDTFDLSSVPLIQKLLDDLVHTTESYRALKLRNSSSSHELETYKAKLDVLYQDNARLLKENNALHLQLIKDAEGGDSKERRSSLTVKKLEDEIAELKFWKKQAIDRYLSLETSHDDLKKRLEELVEEGRGRHPSGFQPPDIRLVDAHVAPGFNSKARVDLSAVMEAADPHATPERRAAAPAGSAHQQRSTDLVHASELRTAAAERELHTLKAQLLEAQEELAQSQHFVSSREDEIARLSSMLEGGRDVERMTLEYRNEANEKTIISLNQQVEFLTLQLSRVESEAAQGRELQTTMAKYQKEKERLTANLQETLRENSEVRASARRIST